MKVEDKDSNNLKDNEQTPKYLDDMNGADVTIDAPSSNHTSSKGLPATQSEDSHNDQGKDGELRRSLQTSSIGIVIVVSTVIGILLGSWLDKKFGTKPVMTIIFMIIGLLSGLKSAYMFLKQAGIFDKDFGKHLSTGSRDTNMSPYKIFRRGYKRSSSGEVDEDKKEKIITHPTVEQNLDTGWEDKSKEDAKWAQLYITEDELEKELAKDKTDKNKAKKNKKS